MRDAGSYLWSSEAEMLSGEGEGEEEGEGDGGDGRSLSAPETWFSGPSSSLQVLPDLDSVENLQNLFQVYLL